MRAVPPSTTRRCALLAAALVASTTNKRPLFALEVVVPSRTDAQILEQKLYAPLPESRTYQQQVNDAITIQSMIGSWKLQETYNGQQTQTGTLTFRGAAFEERGSVLYAGEAANGRGPWIIKADGFGRSPEGKVGGAIERKALWKLRRGQSGTFQYAGRVAVASYRADGLPRASIEGDIVQLINGGKPKGGTERKVGVFKAVLERRLTAAEEQASTDSAAAGGQPEMLQMKPVMNEKLVYKQSDQYRVE